MIDRQRLVAEFLDLVQIDSPSKREGRIASRLAATLEGLGVAVEVDDAGRKVGGETGNLLAKLPGSAPGAAPLLLCAHMDTVVPGEGVKPIVRGDVVRTDGTTVLGGDDKAGVVAILEALRVLGEARVPHRLDLPDDAPIVGLVKRAAANLGQPLRTRATGGGCDANVLNGRGLAIANLGCGMREIRTVNEWIDVRDIVATAELLVETVRLHAAG